jgi:hypothetical protein
MHVHACGIMRAVALATSNVANHCKGYIETVNIGKSCTVRAMLTEGCIGNRQIPQSRRHEEPRNTNLWGQAAMMYNTLSFQAVWVHLGWADYAAGR